MKATELKEHLIASGVNPRKFDLEGGPTAASEGIVLGHEGVNWIVKDFERGRLFTIATFSNEDDACDKVLELLSDPFYSR